MQHPAAETAEDKVPVSLADPVEIVLTVEEAARRLGVGRTTMYSLVSDGEVQSVLIGRLRRIPVKALHQYVDSLMTVQRDRVAA